MMITRKSLLFMFAAYILCGCHSSDRNRGNPLREDRVVAIDQQINGRSKDIAMSLWGPGFKLAVTESSAGRRYSKANGEGTEIFRTYASQQSVQTKLLQERLVVKSNQKPYYWEEDLPLVARLVMIDCVYQGSVMTIPIWVFNPEFGLILNIDDKNQDDMAKRAEKQSHIDLEGKFVGLSQNARDPELTDIRIISLPLKNGLTGDVLFGQ